MVGTRRGSRAHRRVHALSAAGRRGAAFGFAHDDYERRRRRGEDRRDPRAHAGDPADRDRRGPGQRRGDRRGARRRRAVARPLRPHQLHGHPGRSSGIPITSPRSQRIVAACDAHGKAAAFLATDDDWAREYAAHGFRLIAYGLDQAMLQNALAPRPRRAAPTDRSTRPMAEAHSASASRATSSIRAASPRSAARRSRSSTARPDIDWEYLPEVVPEITPDHAARYDALYVNMARTPGLRRRPRAIAGCASSRGTASATTRSTSRR